ncbi:MAG: glycolate oxidase subunit GlcE [Gammaproteobacteria bacterium]|nr:glycolate oxidase subunit GlcE [Gammaproteobacteria bacterium]
MTDLDDSGFLVGAIESAVSNGEPISFLGHGSKPRLVENDENAFLCTADHSGITEYRPDELVISARSGTPLAEIEEVVHAQGQMLPSDPPMFNRKGTIGGAVASGLSGPGRPWYGSTRDSLLGVEVVNGKGQRLNFGGKVIKNVAGFDITRLYAGSKGTLGLILSATFKLLPLPELVQTVELECSDVDAHQVLESYSRRPSTLSGSCHFEGTLYLRFAGASSAVKNDVEESRGSIGTSLSWTELRDQALPFFGDPVPIWRVSLERGILFENVDEFEVLSEWNGSLIWVKTPTESPPPVSKYIGRAEPFRNLYLEAARPAKYAARIKQAFDPSGIFEPNVVA